MACAYAKRSKLKLTHGLYCTQQRSAIVALLASIKETKFMPYKQIADLPNSVKERLPKHAQEIFRAAFNSALEEYEGEESAFRVAWSAVKRDYEKGDDGHWHKKAE
jgi:cation transport regulator